MNEITKNELFFRRLQLALGVVAAVIGIVVGVYNFQKVRRPEPLPPMQQNDGELRAALEGAGATWIRNLTADKKENTNANTT